MITIISGPQGSGKSRQAQEIAAKYKKPVFITREELREEDAQNFDLIVVDEFALSEKYFLIGVVFLGHALRVDNIDAVLCTQIELDETMRQRIQKTRLNIEIIEL